MKTFIILNFIVLHLNLMAQDIQQPICGRIDRLEAFDSRFVSPRNIDIWIPNHYDGIKEFSVL